MTEGFMAMLENSIDLGGTCETEFQLQNSSGTSQMSIRTVSDGWQASGTQLQHDPVVWQNTTSNSYSVARVRIRVRTEGSTGFDWMDFGTFNLSSAVTVQGYAQFTLNYVRVTYANRPGLTNILLEGLNHNHSYTWQIRDGSSSWKTLSGGPTGANVLSVSGMQLRRTTPVQYWTNTETSNWSIQAARVRIGSNTVIEGSISPAVSVPVNVRFQLNSITATYS